MPDKQEYRAYALAEEKNKPTFVTPWSLVHFMSGGVAKEVGMRLLWFELLHGAYELKDWVIDRSGTGNKNSLFNSVGDQAVATVGWLVGKKTGKLGLWSVGFVASWLFMVSANERVG